MDFKPVVLGTDALLFLLLALVLGAIWRARHSEPARNAWREVGRSGVGMASATVLLAFLLVFGIFIGAAMLLFAATRRLLASRRPAPIAQADNVIDAEYHVVEKSQASIKAS